MLFLCDGCVTVAVAYKYFSIDTHWDVLIRCNNYAESLTRVNMIHIMPVANMLRISCECAIHL